jgi:hypothetical protein
LPKKDKKIMLLRNEPSEHNNSSKGASKPKPRVHYKPVDHDYDDLNFCIKILKNGISGMKFHYSTKE